MFDNLSDKLDKALHLLKGHGKITDVNVADTLKEVRRALLDADVNFKIAKDFTTKVKEKAIGENVLQHFPQKNIQSSEDAGCVHRSTESRTRYASQRDLRCSPSTCIPSWSSACGSAMFADARSLRRNLRLQGGTGVK